MTLQLSATNILDTLIPYMDNIEERYSKVPYGAHIYSDSPYRTHMDKEWAAERIMNVADDLLSVSGFALYSAVLIARRWYNRTGWLKCLPEKDAERLLNCMIEQYPKYR